MCVIHLSLYVTDPHPTIHNIVTGIYDAFIHPAVDRRLDDSLSKQFSASGKILFNVLIHTCTFSVRVIMCICSTSESKAKQLSIVHFHQLCLSSQCPTAAGSLSWCWVISHTKCQWHETIIIHFLWCCMCSGFLGVVLPLVTLFGLCGYWHTHGIHSHRDTHMHVNKKRVWKGNSFTC